MKWSNKMAHVFTFPRLLIAFVVIAVLFYLTGCGPDAQTVARGADHPSSSQQQGWHPTSSDPANWPVPGLLPPDGHGNYIGGRGVPQDLTIYYITGKVLSSPGSVTNQWLRGSFSSSTSNGYGYASGSTSGGTDGKSIVRFYVTDVVMKDPYGGRLQNYLQGEYAPIAKRGDFKLLKFIGSNATGLQEGDTLTAQCRVDTEFTNAVAPEEMPALEGATRELDWCRVVDSTIIPADAAAILSSSIITNTEVISP